MEMNQKSGASSPMDLIPNGYLCWAMVTLRGIKTATTGSRYADVELTIAANQPYARKKIFTKIADPDHMDNSEKYRQMGMASLTRMVEAAGLVNPEDSDSYKNVSGRNIEAVLTMLDGKYVAIRVRIEPGAQGYEDKNEVGEYLTPNAASQSHKKFIKLTTGDHGITAAPVHTPFGSGAQAPAQRSLGFAQQDVAQQNSNTTAAAKPAEQRGFNPNSAPAFLKAGQT